MFEKIKNNRLYYSLMASLISFVVALVVWPLLDYLFCRFIQNEPFVYQFNEHVSKPIYFTIFYFIITYLSYKVKK